MAGENVFHEHWYRIRDLKVSLAASAVVSRQRYQGKIWYIIASRLHSKYYRLNAEAYKFIALLNGTKTVDQVWHLLAGNDPYNTPTQGEIIQVLSQLFAAGLLQGSISPDTGAVLRGVERVDWEGKKAFLGSIFYPRIPLFDPDRLLEVLAVLVAPLVSWLGALLWLSLVVCALWNLAGNTQDLTVQSKSILTPTNLPWLYLALVCTKLLHECGHGLMCKIWGKREGEPAEVHTFGIMLLVFSPLPYVDVSSAWMLKRSLHRVLVGLGGIICETALAALAVLVWVRVEPGSPLHTIAYNIMFVSGVSTVIFNINPLLRYDGYYVMCDLLGMPNLAQRANTTLLAILKKIFLGVETDSQLTYNLLEKVLFPIYGILAVVYRIVVFVGISMFVADQLFIVGVLVAAFGIFGIVVKPFSKFIKYVFSSTELRGKRRRAVGFCLSLILALVVALGIMPFSDYDSIEGVVQFDKVYSIRSGIEGVVEEYSAKSSVDSATLLLGLNNYELESKLARINAEYEASEYQVKQALVESPLALQIAYEQQEALKVGIEQLKQDTSELKLFPPVAGLWIPDDDVLVCGAYINKGQEIGKLFCGSELEVRCVASQDTSAAIINEGQPRVELRLKKSPEVCLDGMVVRISPAGSKELPSAALSDIAGGELQTTVDKANRRLSSERLFEIVIEFDQAQDMSRVFAGQTVVARIKISDKPLLVQLWDGILQILQRKYRI